MNQAPDQEQIYHPQAPEGFDWMEQIDLQVGSISINAVVYSEMSRAYEASQNSLMKRGLANAHAALNFADPDEMFAKPATDGRIAWALNVINVDEQQRVGYIEDNYASFVAQMQHQEFMRMAANSGDDEEDEDDKAA